MAADAAQPEKQLAHMVYFTLAEKTPENRQKLIDACKKYLTKHDGGIRSIDDRFNGNSFILGIEHFLKRAKI